MGEQLCVFSDIGLSRMVEGAEGDERSGAVFSHDRVHRYSLWRFQRSGPYALFLGVNPSDAGAYKNDHTVTKCIGFTERWGYAGFFILNPFALVSTDQLGLLSAVDPVGPKNDMHLRGAIEHASIIVCAWGAGKSAAVRRLLAARLLEMRPMLAGRDLRCLGRSADGSPRHPLMLAYSTPLEPCEVRRG